jgi:putative FmdB family regulatory protein
VPTYQYACTECADRTEVVQRFSDDALTVCTVCGGRLRKVFSPVGIVFKGSGFYRTDSRNGSSTVPAKDNNGSGSNGSESSGSDSSSSSTKSEKSEKSSGSGSSTTGSSDSAEKTSATATP